MDAEDKIGTLFKETFREHREEVSLEEMERMGRSVSESSFYRFNPQYFNIYYALSIVSGLLITMALGGHYIYTQVNRSADTAVMIRGDKAGNKRVIDKNTGDSLPDPALKSYPIADTSPVSGISSLKTITSGLRKHHLERLADQKPSPKDQKKETSSEEMKASDERTKEGVNERPLLPAPDQDSLKKIYQTTPPRQPVIIRRRDTIYQIDTVRTGYRLRNKK